MAELSKLIIASRKGGALGELVLFEGRLVMYYYKLQYLPFSQSERGSLMFDCPLEKIADMRHDELFPLFKKHGVSIYFKPDFYNSFFEKSKKDSLFGFLGVPSPECKLQLMCAGQPLQAQEFIAKVLQQKKRRANRRRS